MKLDLIRNLKELGYTVNLTQVTGFLAGHAVILLNISQGYNPLTTSLAVATYFAVNSLVTKICKSYFSYDFLYNTNRCTGDVVLILRNVLSISAAAAVYAAVSTLSIPTLIVINVTLLLIGGACTLIVKMPQKPEKKF